MPAYVGPGAYVSTFKTFYIDDFVRQGGSAVRCALASPETRMRVAQALTQDATDAGFLSIAIDTADVRIQQLQDVFFAIARSINWITVSRQWLIRMLSLEFGTIVEEPTLEALYARDNREPFFVRQRVEDIVTRRLFRREGLSSEFKRAASALIWSVLDPASPRSDVAPSVESWLRGELPRINFVKPAMLYRKLGKTSARPALVSLCRWLRDLGITGVMVTLDVGALSNEAKGLYAQRYTRSAIVDAYEVLRQFIDAIDEAEGLVLTIIGGEDFADGGRGTELYPALRTRLSDDVWDTKKGNPLAPMVRICE